MNEYDDTYKRFDIMECLKTEEDIAAYLAVSWEEDTPEEFAISLATAARARAKLVTEASSTQSVGRLFRSLGLSLAPLQRIEPGGAA